MPGRGPVPIRLALVGDRDDSVVAHRAIARAIPLAARVHALPLEATWLPTERIADDGEVARFHGVWCVPASPYRSMDGALRAIRVARERGIPFLGTCGGFQHAVVEYARDVLGWADAEHGETAPHSARAVIAPLSCGLVEVEGRVHLHPGTRLALAYGTPRITGGYHCNYGLNEAFRAALVGGPLEVAAHDDAGDVRALELTTHPFWVATLFQPEREALGGRMPPIVGAFAEAAAAERSTRIAP